MKLVCWHCDGDHETSDHYRKWAPYLRGEGPRPEPRHDEIDKRPADFDHGMVNAAVDALKKEVLQGAQGLRDVVNHPPHYTSHPSGVECIDVVEHMGFNLGNAMKYIWRADDKGAPAEDLRKAIWYLNRELKRRTPGKL